MGLGVKADGLEVSGQSLRFHEAVKELSSV